MTLGIKQLGGILGIGAMTAMGLTIGCGADSPLGNIAEQCGLTCSDKGVADGNFAISGNAGIDGFFKSVVNFKGVATGVAADIKAELDGIQLAFGISDADLKGEFKGNLGAAIKAKLSGDLKAKLTVDAQPPKCEVDASLTAQATVDCQASAGCEVDPGKASVSCMGKCEVEASASGECSADAEVKCELSGPSVECTGECSGSCTAQLDVAAACEGTCKGECMGTCEGDTDNGAGCSGKCDGMCKGSCEVSGMAALNCEGTCNGSCKATPPSGKCDAQAKASCEFEASAEAKCEGSCDGEFEPPKAECNASASCEASAKADAKFSAKCTPPSIDVDFTLDASLAGNADAKAQADFIVSELKLRLPRLLASFEKANLVINAGEQLTSDGKDAIEATIDAFTDGEVGVVAAYKIGSCVPKQLTASANVVADAGKSLAAQVQATLDLKAGIGL